MTLVDGPISIRRNRSMASLVKEARAHLKAHGGVVYEAPEARVLRKLERALAGQQDSDAWIHEYEGKVRLIVHRPGKGLAWY